MIDLEQKKAIGFSYVVENETMGKLGEDYFKQHSLYTSAQTEDLSAEYDNIDILLACNDISVLKTLEFALKTGKNITNTIKKLGSFVLTELELFHIKEFMLLCSSAKTLLERIPLSNIHINDVTDALKILDKGETLSPSFAVYDSFDSRLVNIRKQKRKFSATVAQLIRNLADERIDSQMIYAKEQYDLWATRENQIVFEVLTALSDRLAAYKETLLQNSKMLGHIETLIFKANIAKKSGAIRPILIQSTSTSTSNLDVSGANHSDGCSKSCGSCDSENTSNLGVTFEQMYNPYYKSLLNGRSYTPIDISLCVGSTVISGANMGGKSFTLNTVALNCYLVTRGMYVYAQSAALPVFDEIFLLSKENEGLVDGLSSFGTEIVRLNGVLESIEKGFCLVLIDEFARGTNTGEGTSIACGVVRYFNQRRCVSLFTTHFDGVAGYAAAHYRVKGLKEDVTNVGTVYDIMNYSLERQAGDWVDKQAIRICELLKLSPKLLKEIKEIDKFRNGG
ncbi:MAG: hypothetical protein PHX51_00170 [Clostridia bacterium]|nr:hypothetical protein [Clostridia bacterium]